MLNCKGKKMEKSCSQWFMLKIWVNDMHNIFGDIKSLKDLLCRQKIDYYRSYSSIYIQIWSTLKLYIFMLIKFDMTVLNWKLWNHIEYNKNIINSFRTKHYVVFRWEKSQRFYFCHALAFKYVPYWIIRHRRCRLRVHKP